MIPFVNLTGQREKYRFELEKAEQAVLDSGCFIGGPQVDALEKELSDYLDGRFVQTCASGTDALTIALMALGLQPEDEVIVPDFTFIAPAECVAFLGATPVFADIDRETLQISPESVRSLIGSKTRGIIAVDLFGQCAPFEELRKIANEHGLWIIEDAAQAFGATVLDAGNLRKACTFGDISITSFYPSKPLGCYGDGGALFTASKDLADKMRMIANHGSSGRTHRNQQPTGRLTGSSPPGETRPPGRGTPRQTAERPELRPIFHGIQPNRPRRTEDPVAENRLGQHEHLRPVHRTRRKSRFVHRQAEASRNSLLHPLPHAAAQATLLFEGEQATLPECGMGIRTCHKPPRLCLYRCRRNYKQIKASFSVNSLNSPAI